MSSFVKYRASFPYGSPDDVSSVCLGARAQLIPGGRSMLPWKQGKGMLPLENDGGKGVLPWRQWLLSWRQWLLSCCHGNRTYLLE